LALMAVNSMRPSVLFLLFALFVVVSCLFFRDTYSRIWHDFCRSLRVDEVDFDMDALLARLRGTPTEVWEPAAQLSVAELQRRVRPRQPAPLERRELEAAYASDFDCCAVCAEPWAQGDVYRRLDACGHVFHIECIDRWALSSVDKGRVPTCPLCKAKF